MSNDTEQTAAPAVDTETSKALKLVSTNIAEFDSLEAGLQDLERKYKGVVYDVTTTKGMVDAKQARAEIREPRYAVQHAVTNAKRPLEALKKALARRGDEIIARIKPLEDPIHLQITNREDEIEAEKEKERQREAEAARVAGEKIQSLHDALMAAVNQPVAVIDEKLAFIEGFEVSLDLFGDRTGEAEQIRAKGLITLKEMRVQREAFDQQQIELARQQEAQRLRDEADRKAREEREAEEQRQAVARREQQEKEDRERRERLDAEEAELNARRKRLDDEEAAARQKRLDAEEAERKEREQKEAAERAERQRVEDERRERTAGIQAIAGWYSEFSETLADAANGLKKIDAWVGDEAVWGDQLDDAKAAVEKVRLALIERYLVLKEAADKAEEARLEQQRKGEERERVEAADKRKRDAADTMLKALRAAKHMLMRDPIDDAKMKVIDQCDAAITEATGQEEF